MKPPTRWYFYLGNRHPPDLGLVEPEEGLLVHFEGVARVTKVREKTALSGDEGASDPGRSHQAYTEARLDPLELIVRESAEEAPPLKAVAGA